MNGLVFLSSEGGSIYSSGQSFYVPWDMSYLTMYKDYFVFAIGAVVVIGVLGGAVYFGIRFFYGLLMEFLSGRR